ETERGSERYVLSAILSIVAGAVLLYGAYRAAAMLLQVGLAEWNLIASGIFATALRVFIAMMVALAWTVPVGVLIGTSARVAAWVQPIAQIAASVPATALFPVLMLGLIGVSGGLNLIAVLLMLMGTQWYLLFNIIAGVTAIPEDLRLTASTLGLKGWQLWK